MVEESKMFLIELYIRWKLNRQMKRWNKLLNTHVYVDKKGKITTIQSTAQTDKEWRLNETTTRSN
jgi:hypothetical protein